LRNGTFLIQSRDKLTFTSKKVLIATGGHPSGCAIADSLGHSIVFRIPSLFSFTLEKKNFISCSGVAINDVSLTLTTPGKSYKERGRILLIHKGLTGPAVLKLSAFAARDLYNSQYQAELKINWISETSTEGIKNIRLFRSENPRRTFLKARPFLNIPKRLWLLILEHCKINPSMQWANLSNNQEQNLLNNLISGSFKIIGRGPFGEEFVTAGGIKLSEIDLSTMESRLISGLYFAGEVMDVDAVTGGFNFQHCWTSGWIAGKAIAEIT